MLLVCCTDFKSLQFFYNLGIDVSVTVWWHFTDTMLSHSDCKYYIKVANFCWATGPNTSAVAKMANRVQLKLNVCFCFFFARINAPRASNLYENVVDGFNYFPLLSRCVLAFYFFLCFFSWDLKQAYHWLLIPNSWGILPGKFFMKWNMLFDIFYLVHLATNYPVFQFSFCLNF